MYSSAYSDPKGAPWLMAAIKQVTDLATRLARECKDRDATPGLLELQRHMRVVQQDFLVLQQSRDKLSFENMRLKKEVASFKTGTAPVLDTVLPAAAAAPVQSAARIHDGFVWTKVDQS